MTDATTFAIVASALVLAPPAAFALSRRTVPGAAAIAAGFAGVGAFLLCRARPDAIARACAGTDLLALYPAALPGAALAARTTWRNQRALIPLAVVIGGYGAREAAWIPRDPAAYLDRGHWQDDCYIQSTSWSCAPAAPVSLLRAIGVETTEAEMARLMRSRPGLGTFDLRIYRGLARCLEGTPCEIELVLGGHDDLVVARAPAIAPVRYDHAVAIVAADPEGAMVLDPLHGPRRRSRAEIERDWRECAILVRRP